MTFQGVVCGNIIFAERGWMLHLTFSAQQIAKTSDQLECLSEVHKSHDKSAALSWKRFHCSCILTDTACDPACNSHAWSPPMHLQLDVMCQSPNLLELCKSNTRGGINANLEN